MEEVTAKHSSWLLQKDHNGASDENAGRKKHSASVSSYFFPKRREKNGSKIGQSNGVELSSAGEGYGATKKDTDSYSLVPIAEEGKSKDDPEEDPETDDDGESGEPNELRIIIMEGRDLTASDVSMLGEKSSDPYVTAKFRGREKQTDVRKHTLNPKWKQKFIFPIGHADKSSTGRSDLVAKQSRDEVLLTVIDYDTSFGYDNLAEDDKLGEAIINIGELSNKYEDKWCKLSGRVQGTSFFGKSEASGAILVKAKVVRNAERAKKFQPDEPMKPAILKFIVTGILALVWLIAFLSSVIINAAASALEYIAVISVTVVLRAFTGIKAEIGGLSIRFGPGDGPTEIVINNLTILNPNGGYKSEYLAKIVRVDLHVHLKSFLACSKWVKWAYLTEGNYPEKEDANKPPREAFKIDMVRIDGLQIVTEKNTSPLTGQDTEKMLVNLKALVGITDDDQGAAQPEAKNDEISQGDEENAGEAPTGLLPKEANNVPLLFQVRNVILSDVDLYPADLIADLLGDPDGCGDITDQSPVELSVCCLKDDFHTKTKKDMLWLGDLIGVLIKKALPQIPIGKILRSAMTASGSKWGGDIVGANAKLMFKLNSLTNSSVSKLNDSTSENPKGQKKDKAQKKTSNKGQK